MPNFDPNKLRVPDLRRILLFHDVEYRSSAKKPELVSLFQANITPKAKTKRRKILPIQPSIEFVLPNGEIKPQIFMSGVSQIRLFQLTGQEEKATRPCRTKRTSSAAVAPPVTLFGKSRPLAVIKSPYEVDKDMLEKILRSTFKPVAIQASKLMQEISER